MVKTVMMPAKYRGFIAGVVGCLLLLGMLGGAPLRGAPAQTEPPTESVLAFAEHPVQTTDTEAELHLDHDLRTSGNDSEYVALTASARSRLSQQADRLHVVTHRIVAGESTWTIAELHNTDIGTVQALNPGTNLDSLVPGDTLRVVPNFSGLVHTAVAGDTVEAIAAAYATPLGEVLKASRISPGETLSIGELIFVPGARLRAVVASRNESQRRAEPSPTPAAAAPPKPAATAPVQAPAAPPAKKTGWIWPLTGGLFFSEYGYREGGFHRGLDVAAPVGTPVIAAVGGTVIGSGWDGGYGYCVTIDHGDGVVTRYAHASDLLVEVGQRVSQGQQVILVGNTGNSTGPHLHFEVLVNGSTVNPRQYLP